MKSLAEGRQLKGQCDEKGQMIAAVSPFSQRDMALAGGEELEGRSNDARWSGTESVRGRRDVCRQGPGSCSLVNEDASPFAQQPWENEQLAANAIYLLPSMHGSFCSCQQHGVIMETHAWPACVRAGIL